jgi:alanyl-tRNA synthetase
MFEMLGNWSFGDPANRQAGKYNPITSKNQPCLR